MKTKKLMISLILIWISFSMFTPNVFSNEADGNTEQEYAEILVSNYSQNNFFSSQVSISNENSNINFPCVDILNVSEENLKNTVQTLQDFDTRYVFSENCSLSAEWIYNKFFEYGLWTEYDYFEYENQTLKNVVGTLNGTSDNVCIISAHYDSINSKDEIKSTDDPNVSAPGADDDGSGVSAVLECARIMSQYRFNATIKFVAFSCEELGLIGSRYYAESMKNNDEKIIGDIQLDMIGYGNNSVDIVTNPESVWIAEIMENVSIDYEGGLNVNKVINSDLKYSDHASFWNNGYSAVCLIENATPGETNPYFHSKNDTIDKLNFTLIKKTTQLCIATLVVLANISFPENVNKYALLIGIEDYPPGVKDLDYTIDDVYDMCDVLINNCYFDPANIRVLTDANATKTNIKNNITTLVSKAKKDDIIIFFFSGHGSRHRMSVYGSTISDNDLNLWFNDTKSNLVVIIDSCYAGYMIENVKSDNYKNKNFSYVNGMKNIKCTENSFKGLAKTNRTILTACDKEQESWEYDELSNGVFTYYFTEGLKSALADSNGNGWVSVEEAFYYAKPKTYEFNNSENPVGSQNPQIYDGIEGEVDISFPEDLVINNTEIYYNQSIILKRNLTITSNGSLVFNNVTLMMNSSFNGEYHIEVQSGGQLYIYNSNITSTNDYCYLFWVRNNSMFEMRDSEMSKCGHEGGNISNRGLIIETDNAIIENCIISENYVGIYLKDSSDSIISNNTILKCMIGISCNNSSVKITGSVVIPSVNFSGVWYATGIECSFSTLTITNNIISGYYVGIELRDSTVTVVNVSIMNPYTGKGIVEDIICHNSSLQIINSTLPLEDAYDINFRLEESSVVNALNTTFNKTKVSIKNNSSLTVSWYLNINVLYQNDTTVKNADVVVCNVFMVEVFNGSTDENGHITNIIVQECFWETMDEGDFSINLIVYRAPYLISASKNGYCGNKTVEMNQNMEIPIYLEDVTPPDVDAGNDQEIDVN
ncbi:MAG: M20/M25/M40 family metallo-hydrolase, partial [Candidatus Thermoplasmatota archaeon]|nr:M20/M25/M40 family metallo-hydrolase [Candidatus Thermoplasmatota archaeon]